MNTLSLLIKPASSLCNYKCTYCFYADVSQHRAVQSTGIMNQDTMTQLIKKATEDSRIDEIVFAFQGGEPTLAGLDYFKNFINTVDALKHPHQRIRYALQTNGSQLNEEWGALLKSNDFLVGLSLDGFRTNHDFYRHNQIGNGTYDEVLNAIKILNKHEVDFNILTVLTKTLAKQPAQLYATYKDLNLNYIQLIPCLPGLDEKDNEVALTPRLFASFYKTFFDLWIKDTLNGSTQSIALFDNVIPMFAGQYPYQCGMLGFCTSQLVIEADGSVYPCDFYVLDQYKLGNINTDSLQQLTKNTIAYQFINEPKRTCKLCATCQFKPMCNGNCKRQNGAYFDEEYCGYQDFLTTAYPKILTLLKR